MPNEYLLAFVPIFFAVDALGILPIFMSLTDGMNEREKRTLVLRSTVTALVVALLFLWFGRQVFLWLGITINDFLVAGGAVLFILAIRDLLVFGKSTKYSPETVGVVPLAVPLIVGPAVLTTSMVLLTTYGLWPTLVSIVLNIVLCAVALDLSKFLSRLLGESGSHTLSKIASLLLGTIGVMLIRRGLTGFLS